ncbi:MAG: hypothetical protein QME96_01220 [Myxococcota bacterium]|nr:hypothetical protein [Myxococcota bacterium]
MPPGFWKWLLTAAGALLGEVLFEAIFGGDDEDDEKTRKLEGKR